jgi:alkylation response protein AidB-like acyl-CoA dehydrogenase
LGQEASERESLRTVEAAREREWHAPSFLRELFLGRLRLDLLEPDSAPDRLWRPEFQRFYDALQRFLDQEVEPIAIDAAGEYPPAVLAGLRKLGAFGMKIPKEYGGLGFTQAEYARVMELLGSFDGNITALLSAHQSIGVPRPLELFGSEEQKRRYLSRCAAGAISAFALTEAQVGSDPARLSTRAELTGDGEEYVLNGEKLWCTNGTLAELLVVMARDAQTDRISAFIVETAWPGVRVEHRCHFMGLRALANGVISFTDVRVPRANLIGPEGKGLKVALATLNTGRLTLPAAVVGTAKRCLQICRKWANARVQWGVPIGRHEAIAHKIADMAATTFAMESLSEVASRMADDGRFDIRLEAAAAKDWNTTRAWEIVDDTMQIRGGRGYETEASLARRGEPPIGVERLMRDSRINRIFEGSSEIMHLFMAREALDRHLQAAGALADPDATLREKLAATPSMLAFYAAWYPGRWVGWGHWPRFARCGALAHHVRFAERSSRRLARAVFHGMLIHRAGLQRRQAFLFRTVDIGVELFAISVVVVRATSLVSQPEAARAHELADLFCRGARRRIRRLFADLWRNDDARKVRVARGVLAGDDRWLEDGAMELPFADEDLIPRVHVPPEAAGEQAELSPRVASAR